MRHDFTEIVRELRGIEGIRRIAMTTNGYRLEQRAQEWRDAGVDAVNVSIDTLDPHGFAKLTGHDKLDEVVAGVDAALDRGFDAIKVNSVLLRDLEGDGWEDILRFVQARDISWRFIEFMRTNDNSEYHQQQATPGETVREKLLAVGWKPQLRDLGSGPAVDYAHPAYRGRIGLIAPYSPGFCESCNRLRLSSRGRLHLCLFGTEGLDLRDLLQHDEQQDELVTRIVAAMPGKTRGHRLNEGNSGSTPHLASIGG